MKRLLIILCTLFSVLSLSAQQGQKAGPTEQTEQEKRLYVFGSEYSGPTIALLKDIEQNTELKKRLSELEYSYLDGDHINAKQNEAYRYMLIMGNREYPVFIISDQTGNVYKTAAGYESAVKLLEWLDAEDLATRTIVFRPGQFSDSKLRRMAAQQKKVPFSIRLANSPWGLGAETGVIFSNLAGSEDFTRYKTGYYASLYAKRYLPWKMRIQAGLAFNSLGGKHTGSKENLRLNYLSLPVDFERVVFRPRTGIPGGADLNLGIGIYGSYLLAKKIPDDFPANINKWDAGIRLRLILQQGSFRLSAGWIRGFVDLMPGPEKAYNNAFQLGLAITLGD